MSEKADRVASLVEPHRGKGMDPHYLAYFECFNRELFFEAHEVLEHSWLPVRNQPQGSFFKGLIQLAGAFVHLQKGRGQPAVSLFKLARNNLLKYAPTYERLNVSAIIQMIDSWLEMLGGEQTGETPFLAHRASPKIRLVSGLPSPQLNKGGA